MHSFPPVSWHSLHLVNTMPPHVRDDQGSFYQQVRAPHCKLAGTRWSSSKVSFHSQLPPVSSGINYHPLDTLGYILGLKSMSWEFVHWERVKEVGSEGKKWTEIHLQKRPHPIPGKQRSCVWPSQLPHFGQGDTLLCFHPSTSWSSQWI